MPSSSYFKEKPKTLNPSTGQDANKAKTYVTPTYPNKHLDAGVKNTNDYDPGEKYTTSEILGEMTEYPKPITKDKARTNSPRNN